MIRVLNDKFTNDIVSFEQLGPVIAKFTLSQRRFCMQSSSLVKACNTGASEKGQNWMWY